MILQTTNDLRIAIVGATGAVGRVAIALLLERGHPAENIILTASKASVGKRLPYGGEFLDVSETSAKSLSGADAVFISATSEVSRTVAPEAVRLGALVIDDGSTFRMRPEVPLVVPEVNGRDVENHSGIISIPNCATTPLSMVLGALRPVARAKNVTISTYQAVTGAGARSHLELLSETRGLLDGNEPPSENYPYPIAFNVIPQIDAFDQDGYTGEERKIVMETKKILHDDSLGISATCVRVPVEVGHSAAIQIEFDMNVEPKDAAAAIESFPGMSLLDDPNSCSYPTPRAVAGKDAVFVGRIRKDSSRENALLMWVSSDNLRKGAALNSLQILDEVIKRQSLQPIAKRRADFAAERPA